MYWVLASTCSLDKCTAYYVPVSCDWKRTVDGVFRSGSLAVNRAPLIHLGHVNGKHVLTGIRSHGPDFDIGYHVNTGVV